MSPQPIAAYLTDFDAPPARPAASAAHPAPPTAHPDPARAASAHLPANDVPANDEGAEQAFAAGKEEGVRLAEARHALERRKHQIEEDRAAARRVAEAEERIGALFATRLREEMAGLEDRLSREVAACLVPFVTDAAERVAAEAMARDAARLVGASRWSVSGPRRLIDAFTRGPRPRAARPRRRRHRRGHRADRRGGRRDARHPHRHPARRAGRGVTR